jgi:DNA-binding protein HU-beta
MNKAELIRRVAADAALPHSHAERAVTALLGTIERALTKGDKVTLVGFGSFTVHGRSARMGRNPKSGATIQIKPKKVVKFKAGTRLAGSVR